MLPAVLRGLNAQRGQLAQLGARAFTSSVSPGGEVAVASSSPFLKFSNPLPQSIDYSPLLPSVPEAQVTTLPNGLRVASEVIPFAETATVGIYVNAGSRFETDATSGAANFLERVLFKGTKTRSGKDLAAEVDSIGATLGAYTGRESTFYYAKVLKKDVGKAASLLSDIVLNPKLDESVIEQERSILLAELEGSKPISDVVFDHLHATAFQFSPLGRPVVGPADVLAGLSSQDLAGYLKANFTGPRTVLVGAGAVDHAELVTLGEKLLGSVPDDAPGSSVAELIAADPTKFTGSSVYDRRADSPQLGLAVAFKGASWSDPDSIPLLVMQTMLGSWDSKVSGKHAGSLLTQKIATDGIADGYAAFSTNYQDGGLFGVYALTDRDRSADLSWVVLNETVKLCYEVNEADVARARNKLKSALLYGLDSSHSVAESLGRDLVVYGRRLPKAELLARIDAVDADTVRAVADRFIYDQDPVIAAVGDSQFIGDYNWFRRRTYWIRY